MLRASLLLCCRAAGTVAEAVVHFLGGAFVGAAPQLSYRSFLEGLAARGVLVSEAKGRQTVHYSGQLLAKIAPSSCT
jgi:UDP-N-acetylglucosamine enolpyruvyl transferase